MNKKNIIETMLNDSSPEEMENLMKYANKIFSKSNDDIVKEVKKIKNNESISNEQLLMFSETVSTFLDDEQKKRLEKIIEQLV